jgi:predicted DNA-binding ribbon-helix-helix protein
MKSPIVKRSIVISGRKTSVSLEEPFWSGMKEISQELSVTLFELVGAIDTDRRQGNLSVAGHPPVCVRPFQGPRRAS